MKMALSFAVIMLGNIACGSNDNGQTAPDAGADAKGSVPDAGIDAPVANGPLTITTTAVPYPALVASFGSSKDLDVARARDKTGQWRWWFIGGDHRAFDTTANVESQDGDMTIVSFTVGANDWRMDQPYYIPDPSQVQIWSPDEAMTITRPSETDGDEIWVMVSARVRSVLPSDQRAGKATILNDLMMAYNTKTLRWRSGLPNRPHPIIGGGDQTLRGTYDAAKDRFISACAGLSYSIVDGKTGTDLTTYETPGDPTTPPQTYGDYSVDKAGIVGDPTSRLRYVYDYLQANLYEVNLDTFALRLVAKINEGPASGEGNVHLVWDPDLQSVIVRWNSDLFVVEVATGNVTQFPAPDGFKNGNGVWVASSTLFFDDETRKIVAIGGIDWDTYMYSPHYWVMDIKHSQ